MSENTTPPPVPQLTGKEEAVILFTAETNDNRPFFAYIKLTLLKLAEFQKAQEKGGPIDLNRLGEVIETGWGHQPPKELHEKIAKKYGDILKDG